MHNHLAPFVWGTALAITPLFLAPSFAASGAAIFTGLLPIAGCVIGYELSHRGR